MNTFEFEFWRARENSNSNSSQMVHMIKMMVTPRVRREAQRHFGCDGLEGTVDFSSITVGDCSSLIMNEVTVEY